MASSRSRPGRAAGLSGRFAARLLLGSVLAAVPTAVSIAGGPGPPTANRIMPTGRTAMTVTVNGSVTDITTTTLSGGNAYNDFSQFSTAAGTTVDLEVPSGANNLVNIVRNAPVYVNGILNSYKDGQIGGNVVFADPYGFIVGSQGTINVGGLVVRTPTSAFLDQLINSAGTIDSDAAQALLAGDIPLSPDGRVSIRGKVNADGNITLNGQSVAIGRNPAALHAAEFAATVNDTGLKTGTAIVANNGSIDIVAAGDVSVNGQVSTGASAGNNAGPVRISAGKDIDFGSKANVIARGSGANSSGGNITVYAEQDVTVVAGARFDASAGTSGNGGQIEISAVRSASVAGGTYNVGAANGTPGAVLFDPTNLTLSGTITSNSSITEQASNSITVDAGTQLTTSSGTVTLTTGAGGITVAGSTASPTVIGGANSLGAAGIELDGNAVLVTRPVAANTDPTDPTNPSTGNSGSITLNANGGTITINPGTKLLTFATDSYLAGNIMLNAGSSGTITFPADPNFTANATLATRVIASGTGASLVNSISSGNSGDITFIAGTINLGTGINTAAVANTSAPGEQLLANAAADPSCAGTTYASCVSYTPGTITFQVGSYNFSPSSPVLTEGANLVVNASGTVTFPAGSLINTRHQAPAETDTSGSDSTTYFSPTDPTSTILDSPGNVTITAAAISYPNGINTASGAAIYAGGYGGSYGFLPGTITFNIPNLTVSGTIASAGAHLVLNSTSGALTVAPDAVLVTREVAAGTDPTDPTKASTNESGDLTLTTTAGNNIVIGPGAELLTFSTDTYYAGNINLMSGGSVVFTAPGVSQSPAELVARSVSSTDATANGFYALSSANSGNVTLSAGSGSGSVRLNGGINSDNGPTILAGASVGGTFFYAPGTITIEAPAITVGAGAPLNTLGATLDLEGSTSVTVNGAIDTRGVAQGADPSLLTNLSTSNSGSVKVQAPNVTIGPGGAINAFAVGSYMLNGVTTPASPGGITVIASSLLSLASGAGGSATFTARGVAAGAASVAAGTADAAGGTISITAPTIDLTGAASGINTPNGYVMLAAGGNGNSPGTISLTANSIDFGTTINGLGANVSLTASSGNVTLEPTGVINTEVTNDIAGNITITGTLVMINGNGVNQTNTVQLLAAPAGTGTAGTITLSQTNDLLLSGLTVTTSGAGFTLQTAGSLSLGSTLSIDTRDMNGGNIVGPAGNITLIGNNISLGEGINGTGTASLQAAGGNGFAAGTIALQWTGSEAVTLSSTASFNGDGANLTFQAAGDLTIGDGTVVDVGGDSVGVTAKSLQLSPTSFFNAKGVKLGETSPSANFDVTSNLSFGGVDLTISTANSITVEQGVILSTRKTTDPFAATPAASTGNSGSITLSAPSITVLGTLDAGVTNAGGTTYTAGDVILNAAQTEQPIAAFGNTKAATSILLGNSSGASAVIIGNNISLLSTATSDSEPFSTLATGFTTIGVSLLADLLTQVNGSVQLATATSTVHVYGGASLTGSGDVIVQAVANTTASDVTPDTPDFINLGLTGGASGLGPSLPRQLGLPLNSGFAAMEVTGTATALVDTGASITAGGTLSVRAHNTDVIHSDTAIVSTNNTLDVALAYSSATINSTAIIANGATINAGAIRVIALNTNSWETSADVADMGQGKGGIVLALAYDDTSNATALMNDSVTLAPTLPAGVSIGILIQADSDTTDNVVSATAESGSGNFVGKSLGSIGGGVATGVNSLFGLGLNNAFSNNSATQVNQIRFAFGVALNLDDTQTATALIGGTTPGAIAAGYTPGTIPPPVIDSPGGPVAIISGVEDSGLQTQALSTIRSTTIGAQSTTAPGTTYGFGAAFAMTDLTHTSSAAIDTQASVTAPAVGIDASVYVPLSLPIADWSTPKAVMDNILSFLPTILDNSTAEVDTTGANAVAGAQQLGVTGSFNFFTLNDTATGWVGQGATITAQPGSGSHFLSGDWSVALDTGNDTYAGIVQAGKTPTTVSWANTVGVTAEDTVAAIDIGGERDLLGLLHPAASSSNTAGASFSETNFTQTTVAVIGDGATVNTTGTLGVDATTLDYIITIVPSATNSGQLAISGMVGLAMLDNQTYAAISNGADITADDGVSLDAAQYLNTSVVAGSILQKASTVAFGIGIAINLPTTDTEAFIGDTSALVPTAPTAPFTAPAAAVSAPSVDVFALTSGQVLTLGLAGSLTASGSGASHETPTNTAAGQGTGNTGSGGRVANLLSLVPDLSQYLPNWPSGPTLPELPDFGLAVSGSAGVDQVALTTKAYVQSAALSDSGSSSGDTVTVSAVRNLWLIAGAGGFAASTADSPQTNVDVAGALALDISNNTTDAYIAGSTVLGYGTVQVAALEGGQQIDVGLDLALTLAAGGSSLGAAGSVSVGLVNDSVGARIDASTITGQGGSTGATSVIAYDNTNIGMGSGAFLVDFGSDGGGSAGIGETFGEINNPTGGDAVDATINSSNVTQFGSITVDAASAGRIIMGTLSASVVSQSTGLGAVTFAQIGKTTNATISDQSMVSATDSVSVEANGGDQPSYDSQLSSYGTSSYVSISDFSGNQVLTVLDSNTSANSPQVAPTKIGSGGAAVIAVAGTIGIGLPSGTSGKNANVGLQLTISDIGDTYSASIVDSTVSTPSTGSVTVAANDSATILGISAGASVTSSSSDSFNLTGLGSLTINLISDQATATVGNAANSTQYSTAISTGSLSVTANNAAITDAFAGNVDISTSENTAAFGAAIAYAKDTQSATALITNSKLNVDGETAVTAAANPVCTADCPVVPYTIGDAAFTVAGSGGYAFAGASTVNIIQNNTAATVTAVSLNDPAVWGTSAYPQADGTSLVVTGTDNSSIGTFAVSVAGASTAGAGAAISYGDIANTVSAAIDGDNGTHVQHPAVIVGGVLVSASSTPSIQTLAAGVAGGEEAGVGGSIVTNFVGLDSSLNPVNTATATIDQNAIVSALGNVYVLALDNSSVVAIAGSLGVAVGGEAELGVGLGSVVNDLQTRARAEISGSQVDAAGQTSSTDVGDVSSVNSGMLSTASGNAPDVSQITKPTAATYPLAETQKTLHGLAVVATADEQVVADTVSIGVQAGTSPGAGIGVNVLVNLLGGSTQADITGSEIDTLAGANGVPAGYVMPDVFVNASSHVFAGNFVAAVGLAGYGGLAGAADAAQVERTTTAYISGGQIGSVVQSQSVATNGYQPPCSALGLVTICGDDLGDDTSYVPASTLTVTTVTPVPNIGTVTVNAATTADTGDIVVGAAAATGAAAGTVAVDIFSPTTRAYVDAATPVVATNLSVTAATENGNNLLGGAAAAGGVAGAGSFGVLVSNDTTNAYVGDQTGLATGTILTLTGSLTVQSTMTDNFNSLVVSGALAGGVGIAGMADVLVIANQTTAGLYLATVGQTGPETTTTGPITTLSPGVFEQTVTNEYGGSPTLLTPPSSVQVDATETVNIAANAGVASIGVLGAGVGAGATAIVVKSNTTATAYDDSINTTGDVQVTATSTKSIQATAVSLGAGSSAGIGGSALLILLGTAPTGGLNDINSELNANGSGTLSSVDNSAATGTSTGASDAATTPAAPTYSVVSTINNTATDAVTAAVEGGIITADTLSVIATSNVSTSAIVGGVGLGAIGAGGGVGFTRIYDTVTATAYGGTFDANEITVQALAQDATPVLSGYPGTANVLAIAGGAGLVGLGAAYGNGTVDDTISASIGGRFGTNPDLALTNNTCANSVASCLMVSAADTANVTIAAYGAEAGSFAVGVVVGQANKNGTVDASVLDNTAMSGFAATSVAANQSGVLSATTIAAAGGLLAAGTGAASTAISVSQVTAETGSSVTLPDGDFSLTATNDPIDTTKATGVGAGGLVAAGVGVAQSYAGNPVADTSQSIDPTQSIYTAATLGSGTITDSTRTGALNVTATSVSAVSADGIAGSGGALSGAAAVGLTNDTALTGVTLNQPTGTLYAGSVTLSATHTTNFSGQSTSVAASIVGGSGAQTTNSIDASTATAIADNTAIKATGAVTVNASDAVTETTPGNAGTGGAGGVLTGSAVLVGSTATLGATVTVGNAVQITSGTDPINNPGAVAIGAGILVDAGDTATLNTGGVLDGASAQNALTIYPTTAVTLGSNDNIYSNGALGIGSYIQVEQASANAYSNTYGLAAVGNASTSVTVSAGQTTQIGAGTTINGLGSVWVTAGLDPSGSIPTMLDSTPNGQGYAYGLVGVPIVTATADLTSNTRFTVDTGVIIESAENVTLGGYPGTPFANPSATGKGDVAGVPTTKGTATPTTGSSAVVTMNGSAIAGEYNTLLINVDPSQCPGGTCVANEISGFPTTITYNPAEDLVSLVNANFPTDPAHAAALASVPTVAAPTITLGTLYAAGGLVYLNASALSGSGTLTANGAPTITVNNPSDAFLVIGPISIPGQPGGSVIFTGMAGAQSDPNLHLVTTTDNVAQVSVGSTSSVTSGGVAPALIFLGNITVPTGNVTVTNANGSIAVAQSLIALGATLGAPNGIDVIGNGTAPQYLAGNPFSEWDASIMYPGGDPNQVTPNADVAISYAANAINPCPFPCINYPGYLFGVAEGGSSASGAGSGTSGFNYVSQVWYGNCGPASYGNCSAGAATALSSQLGEGSAAYIIDPIGAPNYYYFTPVPQQNLSNVVTTVPNTAAFTNAMGGLEARQITIQGNYIAIGGNLILGSPTTVSIDIPSALDAALSLLKTNGSNIHTLTTDQYGNPQLTYDAGRNQLALQNVNATSDPSQILLDGKILGVNPNAQISVNTGLGAVTVTNESGVPLTLNNINVGSTAANLTSTVQIIDTLSSTNTVYRYTTGQGLQVFETPNLTYFCTVGTDCTNGAAFSNASSATFTPEQGARLSWTLQASLQRSVSVGGAYTDWSFELPALTTNPWQYVQTDGSLSGTPAAQLTTTGSSSDPAFKETITAQEDAYVGQGVFYHGCKKGICNFDFPGNSSQTDGHGGNGWLYLYPTSVTMDLNVTVRADYPFNINFGGSTTGSISVTSNSPITVAGTLYNPNGTTTLTSTGSSYAASLFGLTSLVPDGIYQASGAQIQTNNLVLTTTGQIGTSASPLHMTMTPASVNGFYGTLNASAGSSGVYISVDSGATLGQISATDGAGNYGDVVISSEFGLAATSGTSPAIIGRNITLTATAGAIGTSSVAMNLAPNGTGGASGGVVTITALQDIDIERDNGDLLVGAIASQAGNVSIVVPNGAVLDAAAQTPLSVLTPTQVTAIETQLGISTAGEDSSAVMANTVNPVQAQLNGDYAQFWLLKGNLLPNGTVAGTLYQAGSTFTLTAGGLAIYAPLAAAGLGIAPNAITNAQVQAYANNLYQTIVANDAPVFAQYYGANWAQQTAFMTQAATAPAGFSSSQIGSFEVSPNQNAAALLNSAVSYDALQPAGPSVVGVGTPNVTGRAVSITETSNVGQIGTPVDIAFSSILSGTLTTAQAEALSLATSPGQASFLVQPAAGGPSISIPITQLSQVGGQYFYTPKGGAAAAVTVLDVQIQDPAPLFLATGGTLTIDTSGPVYVESTIPSLPVGIIAARGAVSLTAPQSITSALRAGVTNIQTTGGGISLTTESGSIGTSSVPLTLTVNNPPSTGALAAISAGQDAYLNYVGGDLTLGSVFANGTVSITAERSIYNAAGTLNVTAANIELQANGDIGTSTTALQVQVGATGNLSGSTPGAAYIASPTEANQSPVTLTVANFTAGQSMDLTADGPLNATNVTANAGTLTIGSGADESVATATSHGAMTLTAAGGLTVGGLTSVGSGNGIVLTAGATGALVVSPGAMVTSAAGIATTSGTFAMDAGATLLAAGQVNITTSGNATLGAIVASASGIAVTATPATASILANGDADAVLTASGSGGNVALSAANDIGAATLPISVATPLLNAASTNGSIFIAASGGLLVTQLSAPKGSVSLNDTGDLQVPTVTAGLGVTLTGGAALSAGTVTSGGDAALTATTGDLTVSGAVNSGGGATFTAPQGGVTLPTVTASTFISATAGGALTAGTLSSGGAQTLTAGTGVSFSALSSTGTTGSIAVSTTTGDIVAARPGGVEAQDAGITLTASAGNVAVPALMAGTTIQVAAGDLATIGTVASGGAQTLTGGTGVSFGSLSSTGSGGSIAVAATTGDIIGSGPGSVDAQNAGINLTASNGNVTVPTLAAGTTIQVAAGDLATIGTTASGSAQTLTGGTGVSFGALSATGSSGSIAVTATTGSITGSGPGSVDAQNADIALRAPDGTIIVPTLTAGSTIQVAAGDAVTIGTTESGGPQALTGGTGVSFGSLGSTGTSGSIAVTATSGGITGSGPGSVDAQNADIALRAPGGTITVPTLTAGTMIQVAAGDLATIGTTTSGGAQTLTGGTGVSFGSLSSTGSGGSIAVAATSGDIVGSGPGSVDAQNAGINLTASNGTITVPTLMAGTTIQVTAGDLATIGTTTSGGAQTLTGGTGVSFGSLSSTGSGGSIAVAATTGDIIGSGPGSVDAQNAGINLTASNGNVTVPTLTAGTTIQVAAGDLATIGTTTSGGAQTLTGGTGVSFGSLSSTGGSGAIAVTATAGDINGSGPGSVEAQNAGITLTASAGTITVPTLTAGSTIQVTAGGLATIGTTASGGSETMTAGTLALGTLTTTGITGDAGNVALTSNTGGITTGTLQITGTTGMASAAGISLPTLSGGGAVTLGATNDIQFSAIGTTAGGITLNAGGTIGSATSTLQAPGDIDATAAGGSILLARVESTGGSLDLVGGAGVTIPMVQAPAGNVTADSGGGTVNLTTTASGLAITINAPTIVLGIADSGGSQTLGSGTTISFVTLTSQGIRSDPGDIALNAGGAISGTTIAANRNVSLTSTGGTLEVDTLTSTTGSVLADAGLGLTLPSISAAKQLTANSGGTLRIGTATTGGTQTLQANNDVVFTQLTTTGAPPDPGDVDITAVTGSIQGGNINAAGSVSLNGNGVAFGTILAGADGTIVSSAGIFGTTASVGGNLELQAGSGSNSDLNVGALQGASMELDAGGSIAVSQLAVFDSLAMAATTISGNIVQSPSATQPLMLDIAGRNGGVANDVTLNVDAPNGLNITYLASDYADITTTANDVRGNFDVPSKLLLLTPDPSVLVDNLDPQPRRGINVQLYQPSGQFFLDQENTTTTTDAYVIYYQQRYRVIEAAFTNDHQDATLGFDGTSSWRDAIWNMMYQLAQAESGAAGSNDAVSNVLQLMLQDPVPLVTSGQGVTGPAVNLGRE